MALSTQQESEAKALAEVLRIELKFAVPYKAKNPATKQLIYKPLNRERLSYQTEVVKNSHPKESEVVLRREFFQGLQTNDSKKHIYCIAHGNFSPPSGMHIEHSFEHSNILTKQINLLKYLNDNQEFADYFLSLEDMTDYFNRRKNAPDPINYPVEEEEKKSTATTAATTPRSPDPEEILGTRYFYSICFNAIDNLWLCCGSCNTNKNATYQKTPNDPLAWFKDNNKFSDLFIQAVNDSGGLHEGVILSRVYQPSPNDLKIKIGDNDICLHYENGAGLGRFVREWYFHNRGQEVNLNIDFHDNVVNKFEEDLATIFNFHEDNTLSEADKKIRINRAYDSLKKSLQEATAFQNSTQKNRAQSSGSDDSDDANFRRDSSEKIGAQVAPAIHSAKTIVDSIVAQYPIFEKKELYQILGNNEITSKNWGAIANEMQLWLFNHPQSVNPQELKSFLHHTTTHYSRSVMYGDYERARAAQASAEQQLAESKQQLRVLTKKAQKLELDSLEEHPAKKPCNDNKYYDDNDDDDQDRGSLSPNFP